MKGLRSALNQEGCPANPPPQEHGEPPIELRTEPPELQRPTLRRRPPQEPLYQRPQEPRQEPLPASLDAEKGVISSILLNPKYAMGISSERIDLHHFHHPSNKTIFAALFELWSHQKPVDLITLTQSLADKGKLEGVGGPAALAELQFFVPTATNVEAYLDTLCEKRAARQLLELSKEIAEEAKQPKPDLSGLIERASSSLKGIQSGKVSRLPPLDDMSTLLGANLPPTPTELVRGMLHQGSKLIIGGTSKGRKTFSLMDLGISVATGADWWGCETIKGKVCYINFEIQRPFFARRYADICKAKERMPAFGMFQSWTLRGLVDGIEKMAEDIIKRLLEQDYALIIFDPIYKALGNRDENKAGDVASMLNELEAIAVKTGAAIAFGAHYSKGNQAGKDSMDRIGGSGVFARDPDAILTMTPHTLEEHFTIDATLRNFAPQEPFVVKWEWPLFHRDEAINPADLKQPKKQEHGSGTGQYQADFSHDEIVEVLLSAGNGRKPSELLRHMREQSGMSPATFWRLWKKAKATPYLAERQGRFWHVNNLTK